MSSIVQAFTCASLLLSVRALTCPKATLAWQPPTSAINATSLGAQDNKYGFEDGIVVRRMNGSFMMIAAEMYGDPKWVSMRLGVWTSADGAGAWTRQRTLRNSTANFDGSDPHSSSWGPFLVYDSDNSTWVLSYVGYRGAPSNSSGWLENFQGTIYARYASSAGDAGLDSDFHDSTYRSTDSVLLAPDDFQVDGPWPHVCQGLQGTDSMYPWKLNDSTWAAFVGTSHQETPDSWPGGKWPVSLATSPSLAGPWHRYNPRGAAADAPCVDINGGFTENPVVSKSPSGVGFHAVYDSLSSEALVFGYTCSDDGLEWAPGVVVRTPTGCRTPFGLIDMTPQEVKRMTPYILSFGALNASEIGAPNSSLAWSFYTVNSGGYENFQASITYLSW